MKKDINLPNYNDNRNYNYTDLEMENRNEYKVISSFIEPSSKIIDLGCGNGSLIEKLIKEKNVTACGIEISESGVEICKNKKLNVLKGRIDEKLVFEDNSFDYSICNVTIQMVMYPEILLSEMKRISKYQIISFPNFAFYKNRIDFFLFGRMPRPMLFNYKWYSTGHIHQLSIKDFFVLVQTIGKLKIKKLEFIKSQSSIKNFLLNKFPNLFLVLPIFLLEKTE